MNENEKLDQELFRMVHNNPRRQGITRTVGIIVPEEDARCFAAYKAGCQQGGKWQGIAMTIIATLAVIGMTVAALL